MGSNGSDIPVDFKPVTGCVPEWIDIGAICKEAKRYVGLYAVANFDVVAINSGQCVYTTSDRNGEFRRNLMRIVPTLQLPRGDAEPHTPTVVYDCEDRIEWIAPRDSAVRFLYQQF